MPLEDRSIISSVTVSLKQDDHDKTFHFKESYIRFFSGSSDISFSIPQQLNSAIPKQKGDMLPGQRLLEAMHGHIHQKHWDRNHLNPTALVGYHCY